MGDAKAGSKTARAGTKRSAVRHRAVGTRDRVIAYLASVKEIADPAGMASTRLAEAVGYPGSSVAFAQLLSGMERDGLIVREVRGKRTYRITLPEGAAAQATARPANPAAEAGPGRPAGASTATPTAAPQPPAAEFDYDELARRLLIQVVRRLATSSTDKLGTTDALGALSAPISPEPAAPRTAAQPATPAEALDPEASGSTERTALEQIVAGLERELATAWTRHGTLTAENARLREQLWEAQRSLDRARERERERPPITDELNRAEVVLLERLLSPSRESGDQRPGATAS
ncbi:MAG TPA: hypothetical protein VF482_18315 [Trebonia sp.]